MFYTYLWLREDGTPYYVGKAANLRRTRAVHRVGKCPPRERILIQEFPSEPDALAAEKFLISYYGREDLGLGKLLNLTDGGEQGPTGFVVSEELREKHRRPKSFAGRDAIRAGIIKRGKWQQPHTIEVKQKMSETKKGHLYYCPPRLTHCSRGHEMSIENVYIRPTKQGRKSSRSCKACQNIRTIKYLERKQYVRSNS